MWQRNGSVAHHQPVFQNYLMRTLVYHKNVLFWTVENATTVQTRKTTTGLVAAKQILSTPRNDTPTYATQQLLCLLKLFQRNLFRFVIIRFITVPYIDRTNIMCPFLVFVQETPPPVEQSLYLTSYVSSAFLLVAVVLFYIKKAIHFFSSDSCLCLFFLLLL